MDRLLRSGRGATSAAGMAALLLLAACAVYEPISARPERIDSGMGTDPVGAGGRAGASGSAGDVSVAGGGSGSAVTSGAGGGQGGIAGLGDFDASDAGDEASADATIERPAAPCAGFALQFDGKASYAVVMRVVEDDFTLEAWIKTAAVSLTGVNFWEGSGLLYADQPFVAGKPQGTDDFGSSMLKGKFAFGVGNPDSTLVGGTDINTGAWVHIAATRQKSTGTLQVIVNGVLDGTRTVSAQTRSLSAPPYITVGANIIDGRYWSGLMDEIRVWSVVRTPTEIASTMHKPLLGTEPGLVGYWKFDEGSGITSADSSPSKLDATLINSPQFIPSDVPICP